MVEVQRRGRSVREMVVVVVARLRDCLERGEELEELDKKGVKIVDVQKRCLKLHVLRFPS